MYFVAKKKQEPAFKSWEEVNQGLKLIGELDRKIQAAESNMNERIDRIKADTENLVNPLIAQKTELETNIQAFTEYHVDDFKEAKSKEFTYGTVGFRKATSVITRNVKAILEALKQNKMTDCILVTEKLNKEELEKYDDAALQKVGAKRKTEDKYFYKLSVERIDT